MIRIALCAETENYGKKMEERIAEWAFQGRLNIQEKIFLTGEELLADVEQTGYYDIVLTDICLQGNLSGIDTAFRIRQIYEYFCLIFMSGEERYYKEAFRLCPFRYLEKPIERSYLLESLNQAVDRYQMLHDIFVFRYKGMSYCIRLSEVLYFVSDKRVIHILMENGREYLFYGKLDELEKELLKYSFRYYRIHQSYLINGRQVEQFHPRYVVMRNREKIPVTRTKKSWQG